MAYGDVGSHLPGNYSFIPGWGVPRCRSRIAPVFVERIITLLVSGGASFAWLLTSHSLSDRNYAEWLEEGEKPFYVDTWRSEMIITTYDQFLMSLMEPAARYQTGAKGATRTYRMN